MNVCRRTLASAVLGGIFLLGIYHAGNADAEDPADSALDACLATDQGQTNAGMITCTSTAIKAWDARLNQIYQQDMAALDPVSRTKLRASERQWLAFRDAEHIAQAGAWRADRGTGIDVQILGDELSAIKERAGELKTYLPTD